MIQGKLIQIFSLTFTNMLSRAFSLTNNVAQNHSTSPRITSNSALAIIPYSAKEDSPNQRHHALNGHHQQYTKGILIQLASGKIKNIEDLDITDFIEPLPRSLTRTIHRNKNRTYSVNWALPGQLQCWEEYS